MNQRLALHNVQAPRSARLLARLLVGLLVVVIVFLVVTPWQQNIPGSGRVIAFSPEERLQQVEAVIDGRIVKWHVVEGSTVRRGDPIVELTDNDPAILDRLGEERNQNLRTIEQSQSRAGSLDDRVASLIDTLTSSVEAAALREQMGRDRVVAAEQGLTAARAAKITADLNIDRQRSLMTKGLTSTRGVELAELEAATRTAEVERAVATLNAARNEAASLKAELVRTRADADARVEEARAARASAESDVAKSRAELAKLDVRVARQRTQQVTAPIDGTVLRVLARQSGELLKAGAPLAVIVPSSKKDVVELWVDGNDMPMLAVGNPARLQFEGWPALQFSGWPSIAVGTFGGRVLLIDPTDNGKGRFRVLVEPDPNDDPWPSRRFLRQGVRTNGWVLLNIVPIGYELWRQFNGFPPVVALDEPSATGFDPAGKDSAGDDGAADKGDEK
ncbi:HlyD family efflux transporter periplasmic adaptor subunit [Luteitalea sp.]|uniref:HlyD family secretion protein n=1 Tax=Luteitalea sp. TaxID=2004800 RepID=UPI0025C3AFB8|nr:HlyD family efflux transporter periplasmic adaptor subunit [Luteitalea sp.]